MDKNFQQGEFEFTFPNEDKYTGEYCAHVSGLAWRSGRGIYVTHEGQIYEGIWKDDKLDEAENVEITYHNNDKYLGKISKYKYNGPGTYCFANGACLTGYFENNKPSGELIYIDSRNHLWYGHAGDEHALLNREHVFSYELDSERGKGRSKYPQLEIAEDIEPEEEKFDLKELEKMTFAKSTKTRSDINFEDSDWYREYKKFKKMYETVMSKLKESGTYNLTSAEKLWYKSYLKSVKILQDKKKRKPKKIYDPLKDYLHEELTNTCPPICVFYPTQFKEGEEQVEQ